MPRSLTPNRRVNIKVDAQPEYEMEEGENPHWDAEKFAATESSDGA